MELIPKPIDAVVAITYKCNARCTMCDIWKIRDHKNDINLDMFKKLPKSLKYINISGGEPFLRRDIVDICETVSNQCPDAKLIISSNGFATPMIVSEMKKIHKKLGKKVGIAFSIDGMQEMHDKIRRIPNGFNKIINTVKKLKAEGIHDIRLAFTISGENIVDLNNVYNLSKELGVDFTISYAQSSDVYFGGITNEFEVDPQEFKKQINDLIKKQLRSWNPKQWLRAFFAYGIYNFGNLNKQPLPIVSGSQHFFLDPKGDIYPSVVHNMKMGNITQDSFENIWAGKEAQKIRDEINASSQRVWMICTARSAMIQNPFRVFSWIVKTKFFGI